jgi:hypothetical protein
MIFVQMRGAPAAAGGGELGTVGLGSMAVGGSTRVAGKSL